MRCLRARVVCLRFVRAGRLLFHGSPVALTLGCAHTLLCGRFVFARVVEEQACVGVFARGWLGCAFLCSPFGVCVGGVGALVGWWDNRVPPPLAPACLRAHAPRVGAVGVCDAPLGAG